MISFTSAQLDAWINAFLFPLCRVTGLMLIAPVLGDSAIPPRVKVAIAVILTLAVGATLPPTPGIQPGSWLALWIMGRQIAIGLALGLAVRVVFWAVDFAAEISSLQMGLSFATLFDPVGGANTTVISRLTTMFATLFFLAINGHHVLIAQLVESFRVIPITAAPLAAGGMLATARIGAHIFAIGLTMALPMITVLLSINLVLGILNRTAPQMSIFSVGFPISLIAGLATLCIFYPHSGNALEKFFSAAFENAAGILAALA